MSFGKRSTAQEVAEHFREEIRGKNIIITGVSQGGLGAEAIRVLAPYANLIIAAGRSKEKIEQTITATQKETPSANIRALILDLNSLESVRAAAAEVNSYSEPIHVVINNACVAQARVLKFTKEGLESQFGSNHIAHFLFTNLILPRVKAATSASYSPRIVNVSSLAHTWAGAEIRLDDPNYKKRPEEYTRHGAYGQSKTANILYTLELAKRLSKDGILAYTLHPGAILTNLAKDVTEEDFITLGIKRPDGTLIDPDLFKSIAEGTSTHIVAAFDPSIKDKSGAYLVDAQIHNDELSPHATSVETATKLWSLSEELVGQKFDI